MRSQYSSELSRWAMTTMVKSLLCCDSSAIERLIPSSVPLSSAEVASSKNKMLACL